MTLQFSLSFLMSPKLLLSFCLDLLSFEVDRLSECIHSLNSIQFIFFSFRCFSLQQRWVKFGKCKGFEGLEPGISAVAEPVLLVLGEDAKALPLIFLIIIHFHCYSYLRPRDKRNWKRR